MRWKIAVLALSVVALGGCSFSFGGDVHMSPTLTRRVRMTSFGGNIEVPVAPRGASLHAFGGDVRMGEAAGNVVVTSFGGAIDIDQLENDAKLTSFGGDVQVTVDDVASERPRELEIRSFGGDVTLRVPATYSSRIDVRSRYRGGRRPLSIDSDFDLEETRTRVQAGPISRRERRATATIGEGRNLISVRAEGSHVKIVRI